MAIMFPTSVLKIELTQRRQDAKEEESEENLGSFAPSREIFIGIDAASPPFDCFIICQPARGQNS
jgi:hypothetical protein